MRQVTFAIALAFFAAAQGSAQDIIKPVKLITIEEQKGELIRQFFGKVVARQTVDLAFQVGGQIVELPVIEGQTIAQGDMIARLDLEPFELSLRQAQLQKDQADRSVERYQQLQNGVVSQVTLDDAVTAADVASVAVRDAEYALEHAKLSAPYDALVAERFVANFTTIAQGTSIVRLHDMSELRIEIDVPEILFQQAGNDPDVTITARFPASPEDFPVELREFNAETSAVGQTFALTLGLAPPEGLSVLPGSSVTVSATLNSGQTGILVPPTALVPGDGDVLSAFVFEPAEDGTGTLRQVEVMAEPVSTGQMRVTDGLTSGMEIVVMGGGSLVDGQVARRFTGFGTGD